jgi:hypothetical protein
MREIKRRLQKIEDAGPAAHKGMQCVISDCPPEHDDELPIPKVGQVLHSMRNGRVIYLISERIMSAEEWAAECCRQELLH